MVGRWGVDDSRDELTEPGPAPCPECGADADVPCEAGCQCIYCIRKLDIVPEGDEAA